MGTFTSNSNSPTNDQDMEGMHGEEAYTATSVLIGNYITKVTVYLRKVNNPTGTLTCKRINSSGIDQHTFGTIDVSTISGSYTAYEFDTADSSTVSEGDVIGCSYNSTGGNEIRIGRNRVTINPFNPFDGTGTNADSLYYVNGTTYDSIDLAFIMEYDTSPPPPPAGTGTRLPPPPLVVHF